MTALLIILLAAAILLLLALGASALGMMRAREPCGTCRNRIEAEEEEANGVYFGPLKTAYKSTTWNVV